MLDRLDDKRWRLLTVELNFVHLRPFRIVRVELVHYCASSCNRCRLSGKNHLAAGMILAHPSSQMMFRHSLGNARSV